jgi:hypothetical protein
MELSQAWNKLTYEFIKTKQTGRWQCTENTPILPTAEE